MKSSIAAAAALIALLSAAPALADRTLSGAEAQRLLAGKRFNLQCIDGTRGTGSFSGRSVTELIFRRSNLSGDLLENVTPELFTRMRGKTCFHFESLHAGLLAELAELTHAGFERFLSDGVF